MNATEPILDVPNHMLIVDDEEMLRDQLTMIFSGDHEILTAVNGQEGLEVFDKNRDDICAILLDLSMPVMSGRELLKKLSARAVPGKIPIFLITGEKDDSRFSFTKEAYDLGVMDVISKPVEPEVVNRRVQTVIELYRRRNYLDRIVNQRTAQLRDSNQRLELRTAELDESNQRLEMMNMAMIEALATATEFRSAESGEHVRRIRGITYLFLTKSPLKDQFPDANERKHIAQAAVLHDIGKISVPDAILNKPGRFTDEEFEIMKQHTVNGDQMLAKMNMFANLPYYQYARDIARYHHERWDGRGYPDHLVGDQIPVTAQIVSIADVYDALVSTRVYKPPFSHAETVKMIQDGKCGCFNPLLLKYFNDIADEINELYQHKEQLSEW